MENLKWFLEKPQVIARGTSSGFIRLILNGLWRLPGRGSYLENLISFGVFQCSQIILFEKFLQANQSAVVSYGTMIESIL